MEVTTTYKHVQLYITAVTVVDKEEGQGQPSTTTFTEFKQIKTEVKM